MSRTIVIDAMGGDHAPEEIVLGAALASRDLTDTRLLLVGDEPRLTTLLQATDHRADAFELHHAPTTIAMDEKPAEALAAKPDSSVAVAVDLVARGAGDALVSAGNTGATVLACARGWPLRQEVRRAGFAAVVPTETLHGRNEDPFTLILDVGATLEASAEDLVNFALMGAAYASIVSRNERPRVALLSNGAEPSKGPSEVVKAHAMLAGMPSINFIGNIEGLDIPRGQADVIVCSGFIGNVVIKMLEGVSTTVMNLARFAYKESLLWRAGLVMLSGGIRRLKRVTDWRQYGGAPLLGFEHLCIKAHGRSESRAVSNAIKVADKALRGGLNENIAGALDAFKAMEADAGGPPERTPTSQ